MCLFIYAIGHPHRTILFNISTLNSASILVSIPAYGIPMECRSITKAKGLEGQKSRTCSCFQITNYALIVCAFLLCVFLTRYDVKNKDTSRKYISRAIGIILEVVVKPKINFQLTFASNAMITLLARPETTGSFEHSSK